MKNLTVKNFMSVGNATQGIDFDRKNLTLVLGENLDLGCDGSRKVTAEKHNIREMALMPNKRLALKEDLASGEVGFESVNRIVTDQITKIATELYDPKLLRQIYQAL